MEEINLPIELNGFSNTKRDTFSSRLREAEFDDLVRTEPIKTTTDYFLVKDFDFTH